MNTMPDQDGSPTLYQRFLENAMASPTSLAIVDETSCVSTTYGALVANASRLAARLIVAAPHPLPGHPVGIIMPRCIEHVLAQLAVLQCKACCVPLDPELPLQRREAMMKKLGIRVVLLLDFESPFRIQVHTLHSSTNYTEHPGTLVDGITHVIHTSGTTGTPKAVLLQQTGLFRLVHSDHFSLKQNDRVAHLGLPSFDMSLFEVWGTFLSGATLVIIYPEVARDPNALCLAFRRYKVSFAAVPTALFDVISRTLPEAFNSLRSVVFGGEAANFQAVKTVLDVAPSTLSLYNCYGPTECSVFALCYKVDLKDIQEDSCIPIGSAFNKSTVFRVMDSHSEEVIGSQTGELYIGGDGVAHGYFGQPDITNKKFVVIDGIKWYRTGDQVRWRKGVVGGLLDYVGRLDNQVKLRGLRFELEEVDNAILCHGSVTTCATVLMKVAHADPFLVAFIIVKDNVSPSVVEEKLLLHLRNILPAYMIPRLQCCAEFPLTPNGKVNRQALSAGYLDTVIGTQIQICSTNDPATLLAHIWREVLAVPNITLDDDFFLLGASSLSVVTVSYRFRKACGREIPVNTICEHPAIRQLASVLSNDQTSEVVCNNSAVPSIVSTLLEDSKIADNIVPTLPMEGVDTTPTEMPGVAFITGVTGFLGVYMLSELLQSPEIQVIFALVRPNSASIAIKRVKHALQRYNLLDAAFPAFSKICVVPGCLEDDMFGLPDDLYQELVQNVQIIYHLGAKVNYTEPYSLHRPANVIGTRNVIQFAAASSLKPLHYISSVAAYGPVGLTRPGSYLSEASIFTLKLCGSI